MHELEYNFTSSNEFKKLSANITNKHQRNIRSFLNTNNNPVYQNDKWKYVNLNSEAATLGGLIKLHKPIDLIRLINRQNTLAYKIVKHLLKIPDSPTRIMLKIHYN
jgi:hypothetical protein